MVPCPLLGASVSSSIQWDGGCSEKALTSWARALAGQGGHLHATERPQGVGGKAPGGGQGWSPAWRSLCRNWVGEQLEARRLPGGLWEGSRGEGSAEQPAQGCSVEEPSPGQGEGLRQCAGRALQQPLHTGRQGPSTGHGPGQ